MVTFICSKICENSYGVSLLVNNGKSIEHILVAKVDHIGSGGKD